jgi:L-seryl-tRNA(Ser) seleniumtransferase
MKVGKEEAIGMLMAVEMWLKRDHQAEWNRWQTWLDHIAKRVSAIDGVTTSIVEPKGLSNRTPSLSVQWDRTRLGISGKALAKHLLETEPRIATSGRANGGEGQVTGISITPYMMSPGEETIVADRLYELLSNPPRQEKTGQTGSSSVDLSGQWDVHIEFAAGSSNHKLHLRQQGNRIEGTHQGDFVSRDLSGSIEGERVRMFSTYTERHGDSLMFAFTGEVYGDEISGTLDMEEYLMAKWTARRHLYRKD